MIELQIDWTEMHHSSDNPDYILSCIGAGRDEGPLLVVPVLGRRSPRHRSAQVFKNVDWCLGHLGECADQLNNDRWVGIVRGSSENAGAVPGLSFIRGLISPAPRFGPKKGRQPPCDYGELKDDVVPGDDIRIRNGGDSFEEVREAYPLITETLICRKISDV